MLSNFVAVVSGGASGLGAAAVRHIVKNGGKAVVADLGPSKEKFLQLAETLELPSSQVVEGASGVSAASSPVLAFAETDVTSVEQVAGALDLAESAFGEHVNAAISCAGIAIAKKTLSQKRGSTDPPRVHESDKFGLVLNVNLIGSFNVSSMAAERMALREPSDQDGFRGCIVNTASVAAYDGQKGQVAYSASKGGIVGMTLPMARDLSEFGIRVNAVAPGLFLTPLLEGLPEKVQHELGASVPFPARLGNPDEFGHLIGSILSNPMLNGEVIRLDGAIRMQP